MHLRAILNIVKIQAQNTSTKIKHQKCAGRLAHLAAAAMADAVDLMPRLERCGHDAPVARVLAAVLLEVVAAEAPGLSLDVAEQVRRLGILLAPGRGEGGRGERGIK
eukprot:6212119-Pleurochrysis_carterae.AAC.3